MSQECSYTQSCANQGSCNNSIDDLKNFPWLQEKIPLLKTYRDRFQKAECLQNTQDNDSCRSVGGNPYPLHSVSVISLLGGRGTGKTTNLIRLLTHLRDLNPQDLVLLPPLDPHHFAPGDTTLSWFIAKLQQVLEQLNRVSPKGKRPPPHCAPSTYARCPYRVEESSCDMPRGCLELKSCFDKLAEKSKEMFNTSPTDKASDSDWRMRQFRMAKGLEFPDHLSHFIRCLTDAYTQCMKENKCLKISSEPNPPLLILGIDDVDLVPHFLREDFFRFISLTAGIPRLVIITALDDRQAFLTLKEGYLKEIFPSWSHQGREASAIWDEKVINDKAQNLADQFLTKFLPYEGRIPLPEWTLEKRSFFEPINAPDDAQPLYRLLENKLGLVLNYAKAIGETSEKAFVPSPYLNLLPSNARLLDESYQLLMNWPDRIELPGQGLFIQSSRQLLTSLAKLLIIIPNREIYKNIDKIVSLIQVLYKYKASITDNNIGDMITHYPSTYAPLRHQTFDGNNKNNGNVYITIKNKYNIVSSHTDALVAVIDTEGDTTHFLQPSRPYNHDCFIFSYLFRFELPAYDNNSLEKDYNHEMIMISHKMEPFISNPILTNHNLFRSAPNDETNSKKFPLSTLHIEQKYSSNLFMPDLFEYRAPVIITFSFFDDIFTLPLPNWHEPTRMMIFLSFWDKYASKDDINVTDELSGDQFKMIIKEVVNYWIIGVAMATLHPIHKPWSDHKPELDPTIAKDLLFKKNPPPLIKEWLEQIGKIAVLINEMTRKHNITTDQHYPALYLYNELSSRQMFDKIDPKPSPITSSSELNDTQETKSTPSDT